MDITSTALSAGRFRQRTRVFFGESDGLPGENVLCLALGAEGELYAGTDAGLAVCKADKFSPIPLGADGVSVGVLFADSQGRVWVGSGKELFLIKNGKAVSIGGFSSEILDMTEGGGKVFLLTADMLYTLQNGEWINFKSIDGKPYKVAANEQNVCTAAKDTLFQLSGKRPHWYGIMPQFSDMPDSAINAIFFDSWGQLWLGTDSGVCVYDYKGFWLRPEQSPSLPEEKIFGIVSDKNGGKYFASDNGVIYLDKGALKYFGANRWLPSPMVSAVAVSPDGNTVWAATDKGISRISSVFMTFSEKADYYQKTVEQHHVREGFVTTSEAIRDYDHSTGRVSISDNDGLWTADYIVCQAFRYAVTGSLEALENARRSMKALIFLSKVTDIPGFPARAIRREGERGFGDGDKEWHLSGDGSCEWKCETSSDEITGHFLAYSIYYDLCADEEEKKEISSVACAITDHILSHDYCLVDRDGLPTTWAQWNPDTLNHEDRVCWERGINSLEMLAFLKASHHMSGDKKYDEEYRRLITSSHFALNAARHKVPDGHTCHIDDNLGFHATLTLFRLEKDPDLLAVLMLGLEHWWQYERIERAPLGNLLYGIFTHRSCDLDAAVQTMREMPLCLIHYKTVNSTRKGLEYDDEQDYWNEPPQLLRPLPMDERPLEKYDGNPFKVDGGNDVSAEDGTLFLLPYWLGRYYGLINED